LSPFPILVAHQRARCHQRAVQHSRDRGERRESCSARRRRGPRCVGLSEAQLRRRHRGWCRWRPRPQFAVSHHSHSSNSLVQRRNGAHRRPGKTRFGDDKGVAALPPYGRQAPLDRRARVIDLSALRRASNCSVSTGVCVFIRGAQDNHGAADSVPRTADCADLVIVPTLTRHALRSGRFLLATSAQSCADAWLHSCASAPLPAKHLLSATRSSATGLGETLARMRFAFRPAVRYFAPQLAIPHFGSVRARVRPLGLCRPRRPANPCSAGPSKNDIGTITRSAQSAHPSKNVFWTRCVVMRNTDPVSRERVLHCRSRTA
jgi:hypothetical protein